MKKRIAYLHWFATCLLMICASAEASLMIKPSRVVLDERTRSAEVTLLNSSSRTKEYHIEWQEKRQTTSGSYIDIDTGDNPFPASRFIRHSPRKVTIEAGKYQRIKLRLKLPGNTPPGEYRSHLLMRVVNDVTQADFDENKKDGQTLNIIPLLSFSIPVMVRVGSLDTETEITSIAVKNVKNKKQLQVNVSHNGMHSSFGNLFAYMKVGNGKVTKIGEKHSIALFRETKNRITNIPITVPEIPPGAIVQVLYQGEDEFEGQILGKAAIRY